MRVHKLTFTALAVVAGLSLTACQNDDGGAVESQPAAASTASSTGGGSGSAGSDQGGGTDSAGNDSAGKGSGGTSSAGKSSGGPGTAAGTGSQESGKTGKCRTDDLKITATDNTIGGDPDRTVAVQLKNGSGRDCTVSGFAGVDLKTSAGSLSAKRKGKGADPVVLKSGESVYFGINYPNNDSGGSGVRITGLVVTPPNETKSVTLGWPGAATLPVTDGSGSPVTVGPIGSAGQGG